MSSANWVCFDCRTCVRRAAYPRDAVPCARCRKPCVCLGHKIPIPQKHRVGAWGALFDALARQRIARAVASYEASVRTRHALEREMAAIEARPRNKGRARAIELLAKRLGASGR